MSDLVEIFILLPSYFYLSVGTVSLIFGSFLNAAIHRIPIMMEREWQQSCSELIINKEDKINENIDTQLTKDESLTKHEPFNLFIPRSQCPSCGNLITALQNIPIISYIILLGKCKNCNTPISIQYPLVEAFTCLLSLLIAYLHGPSAATVGLILLSWAFITLAMIDIKHLYLPDIITIPLLWLGIIFNLSSTFTDLHSSTLGAIFGYLSLWIVYQGFKLATGKEGMGYGDFKLLAVIGAWGGWEILPFVIFTSALTGAIGGSVILMLQKGNLRQQIPFGPWLIIAGWPAIIYKDHILNITRHFIVQ